MWLFNMLCYPFSMALPATAQCAGLRGNTNFLYDVVQTCFFFYMESGARPIHVGCGITSITHLKKNAHTTRVLLSKHLTAVVLEKKQKTIVVLVSAAVVGQGR